MGLFSATLSVDIDFIIRKASLIIKQKIILGSRRYYLHDFIDVKADVREVKYYQTVTFVKSVCQKVSCHIKYESLSGAMGIVQP